MASKVLKSFLIGIGYDTRSLEAGDKKINASLNGIRSGALGISGALIGAFGAAAGSIAGVANRVDKLAMSTQNLRTSQAAVYSFGNAVKLMGGDAVDALDAIKRFEEIQNNLRLKGDAGPISDLATAGIDVSSLYETKTGEEFMRALADMLPKLDEGQSNQVQSALGLSDGVFRTLKGGADQLDEAMKRASGLTGSVDQLTEDARKLAENASEFGLIIDGVTNEIAEKFLPSLVGAGTALNDFLKESRGKISNVIDYSADNPEATAVLGLSSVTAMAGAVMAKLGLSTIGGAVSKAGTAGLAVTGGAVGANVLNKTLDEKVPGYKGASEGFDEFLKSVTGLDRIKSPIEVLFGKPISKRSDEGEASPAAPAEVGKWPDIEHEAFGSGEAKEVKSQSVDDMVKAIQSAKRSVNGPPAEAAATASVAVPEIMPMARDDKPETSLEAPPAARIIPESPEVAASSEQKHTDKREPAPPIDAAPRISANEAYGDPPEPVVTILRENDETPPVVVAPEPTQAKVDAPIDDRRDRRIELIDVGARGLSRGEDSAKRAPAKAPEVSSPRQGVRIEDQSLGGPAQMPGHDKDDREAPPQSPWTDAPLFKQIFGERSSSDMMPPIHQVDTGQGSKETSAQGVDDIVRALQAAKLKVENNQSFTIQLDGQAIEAKITQVNERLNYETLNDLKTTTER
ncbi:hypothetical protein [Pseudomonas viridiflava]|uniref:hypothetical protein n=1 Tax=Pseudomonas viridiflava TaxID=33069 RepID=UPI000F03AB31|nr:hypothetical protein [Pseudomonas viridiflava]